VALRIVAKGIKKPAGASARGRPVNGSGARF